MVRDTYKEVMMDKQFERQVWMEQNKLRAERQMHELAVEVL